MNRGSCDRISAPGSHATKLSNNHSAVLERAKLCFVQYDFRHDFAIWMAEGGMPLPDLAAILGHAEAGNILPGFL